jgi:hypothetical protein
MKEDIKKADPMMWVFWSGVVVGAAVILVGIFGPRIGLRIGRGCGPGRTQMAANALLSAVEQFEMECGRLPEVGSSAFDSDDEEGRLLAEILLGREEDKGQAQNPRKIPFLSIETARSAGKGGLLYGKESEVLGIYDEWGEPFEILLRKPGERGITLVHRGKTVMIERPVVVFSKGKDRIAGTKDDVRTWE